MTKRQRSPGVLGDHQRLRKTLLPPLAQLPLQMMDWESNHLPEHLWLGHLLDCNDVTQAAPVFNHACDIIDEFFVPREEGQIFLGWLSDFSGIPADRQAELREILSTIQPQPFNEHFRVSLALYPECPAAWLADGGSSATRDTVVGTLRRVVRMLQDPRAKKTVQCRMLGMNRLLKHRKMFFSKDIGDEQLWHGLETYPYTDEETTLRVEQFVRLAMNSVFSSRADTRWPAQFWECNFQILECR